VGDISKFFDRFHNGEATFKDMFLMVILKLLAFIIGMRLAILLIQC